MRRQQAPEECREKIVQPDQGGMPWTTDEVGGNKSGLASLAEFEYCTWREIWYLSDHPPRVPHILYQSLAVLTLQQRVLGSSRPGFLERLGA